MVCCLLFTSSTYSTGTYPCPSAFIRGYFRLFRSVTSVCSVVESGEKPSTSFLNKSFHQLPPITTATTNLPQSTFARIISSENPGYITCIKLIPTLQVTSPACSSLCARWLNPGFLRACPARLTVKNAKSRLLTPFKKKFHENRYAETAG
jgi:hypothetical protein